jgi:hypothetical protein
VEGHALPIATIKSITNIPFKQVTVAVAVVVVVAVA